mmetsp:Transcript_249/g.643  ORF Transcript_249/g.643 Transcript_249/m.643 type:complete len:102 (-) Transcript_249:219-524(-)
MNSAIGTLRSLIRNRDDQERELRQLTKSVRKTMSMQKREVKGVGDIVFTVGKEETTVFEKENESRRDRGEAHYERVKNGDMGHVVFNGPGQREIHLLISER